MVATLLAIYQALVKLSPAKLAKIWQLLQLAYEIFEAEIDANTAGENLQMVALPAEVTSLELQNTEGLNAGCTEGTQQQIDFSRVRKLAKWLNDSGLGAAFISILVRAAIGG
jgi:hypothetical protein